LLNAVKLKGPQVCGSIFHWVENIDAAPGISSVLPKLPVGLVCIQLLHGGCGTTE
jgi:hypothetical protein